MLLTVDIGNTNITFGIYNEDKLLKTFRINSHLSKNEYEEFIEKNCSGYSISDCIIGSVVQNLVNDIEAIINKIFGIKSCILSCDLKMNVKLKVKKPSGVGADRLANINGAFEKYSSPAIIIDTGTATTFEIINNKGEFIGGPILPGIGTQLDSLYKNTSLLPKIEIKEIDTVVGNNTETAILAGVIMGHACAISGLLDKCEEELGENFTVIITGGYSSLLKKYIKHKIDHSDSNLTLDGLRLLYKLNR